MKTLLVVLLVFLASACGWSQGIVTFQNGQITFATTADRLVYFAPRGICIPLTGTNYVAGLWYVPGADNGSLLLNPTGGTQAGGLAIFRSATTTVPGVWNNANGVGATRTLDGVPQGSSATLQVRVWDSAKYNSFAAAFAANDYGWSTPFNYRAPIPTDPATASYMENFRGINACIPEPATVALGLLAAGSWLLARRRAAS